MADTDKSAVIGKLLMSLRDIQMLADEYLMAPASHAGSPTRTIRTVKYTAQAAFDEACRGLADGAED